jgi:hypothetical protein
MIRQISEDFHPTHLESPPAGSTGIARAADEDRPPRLMDEFIESTFRFDRSRCISERTFSMIRKRYRRSPTVESLESMVLLSGFSAATHHAAPALLTKLPAASMATSASAALFHSPRHSFFGEIQVLNAG